MAKITTLLFGLAQTAVGQQILEVKEVPGQLASRIEGVYAPWHARWINGRVWKRSNVGLNSKGERTPPTFFGAICGHEHGGAPTEWCFAECDEELMVKPYYCDVLGHARRWHEAGLSITAEPPSPEYWRWRMATNDWVGAIGTSGSFEVAIRPELDEPAPGERLALRRDGTIRPGAHPGFCLGAEGGQTKEGVRLLFWSCGPHTHELFRFERAGATDIRPQSSQGLCVGANGAGKAALLVACDGAPAETRLKFEAAADGTVRAVGEPSLCLGSGPDRPFLGSEVRLEACTRPQPDREREPTLAFAGGCSAPYLPGTSQPPAGGGPGAGAESASAGAGAELAPALESLWRSMEEKMAQKTDRLERELASLREARAGPEPEPDSSMARVLRALEVVGNSSLQGQELVSRTAQLEEEMARLRALVGPAGRQNRPPASRTKPCANCD